MKKVPYIFVFDIDNTVIGNVRNISNERNLYDMIYDNINDKALKDKREIAHIKKHNYVEDMKNGLLRPGFEDFIKFCKKKYHPCEFYVFTRSSYEWTHYGLIHNIEKAANMKFNTPYYTREDTLFSRGKSLKIIVEHIQHKYKTTEDLGDKILFIDDVGDNTSTYKSRQIQCPKYNNFVYRDIYKNLLDIFGPELLSYKYVEDWFLQYSIPYYNGKSKNIMANNEEYYELHKLLVKKETELVNEDAKKDVFFKILIEKLTDISDKTIKKINGIVKEK
jgi:hypothetical protein